MSAIKRLTQTFYHHPVTMITLLIISCTLSLSFYIRSRTTDSLSASANQVTFMYTQNCAKTFGQWATFSNTCADFCPDLQAQCQPLTLNSCNCGPGSCWDGTTCLPNQ